MYMIMLRQLLVGGIRFGIVATGLLTSLFRLSGTWIGNTTEERQHPDVAEKPVRQRLRIGGLREGVV